MKRLSDDQVRQVIARSSMSDRSKARLEALAVFGEPGARFSVFALRCKQDHAADVEQARIERTLATREHIR